MMMNTCAQIAMVVAAQVDVGIAATAGVALLSTGLLALSDVTVRHGTAVATPVARIRLQHLAAIFTAIRIVGLRAQRKNPQSKREREGCHRSKHRVHAFPGSFDKPQSRGGGAVKKNGNQFGSRVSAEN